MGLATYETIADDARVWLENSLFFEPWQMIEALEMMIWMVFECV